MGDMCLAPSLDMLVVALCADFERRNSAILQSGVPRRTDTEFRYINYKIYDAAREVVGEDEWEIYIKEIGARTGYAHSEIEDVSEVTYKNYKKRIKEGIARKLYLN